MTNTQRHLLKLIKEIDALCQKNSIIYYLAGGSAIGAIRHRGYIPWDDDADILMTRDNYYKFLEVCKTKLPPNRCMMAPELHRDYHNNFARYIDTTTTAIHTNQIIHDDPAGFVIDILVLDPIPDDPKAQKKYTKTLELYADLINPASIYSFRWRMNCYNYFRYRLKIRMYGRETVLNELEQKMFSFKEEDCNKYALRWGGVPLISDKDIYGTGAMYQFEDMKVMLPQKAADYLAWHYGDNWMFVPSHTEHSTHNAVYCFDTPYNVIKQDAYQYYSLNKTHKKFLKRKIILFSQMHLWWFYRDLAAKLMGIKLSYKFKKHFKKYEDKIHKAYKRKDYGTLSNIYSKYFHTQYKRSVIGREDFNGINRFRYPIYIRISDYHFTVGITILIATGDTSKALRFLEVKEIKASLSDEDYKLKNYIKELEKAISLFADEKTEESRIIVEKLLKENVESVSTLKLSVRISQKLKIDATKIINTIRIGEKLTKKIYKNKRGLQSSDKSDGEWLKYRADLVDDTMAALRYYLRAYGKTKNGIIHLEIKDFIVENYDEIIHVLETMYKNKNIECLNYVSKLRSIFPKDDKICSLWANCHSLKKNTPKGIWNAIYNLRRSIQNIENSANTLASLKHLVFEMSNDYRVSELYCKIIFENNVKNLKVLLDEVEHAELELQWKSLLHIYILYKIGKRRQSIQNCIDLFNTTDNSYIRYILCLMFRLELMIYSTYIIDKTSDVVEKDIMSRNKKYIAEWIEVYGDYRKTLEMYKYLKVLPKDCVLLKQQEDDAKFDLDFFEIVYQEFQKTPFSPTAMIRKIYGLNLFYDRND